MYAQSLLSHVRLFETLWTAAHQAPLSMGFSRQKNWSGLPLLSKGSSDPGIETASPALVRASLVAQLEKNLPAMQENWVRSLGWEDSPGEGNGNPLHYSCLENPMNRGAWQGYSPWGHKESDITEQLSTLLS